MTKSEIEFVQTLVGKTLNTPAAEAASLLFEIKEDGSGDLKDGAINVLLDKDSARIQKIKDEGKTLFDNGYKKAQGEALTKFEKDLKDKFSITTDKQGIELIEFVVTEKLKSQGGELDDDKIKRSSPYLAMVDKLTKEKADAVKVESDKFVELQTSIQNESTFSEISKSAVDVITELDLVLPSKEKANLQIKRFLKDIREEYGFEIKDGKKIVTKDGKILEDKHGHMIAFEDLIKTKALEVWDPKEGEPRSGAGNSNDKEPAVGGNQNKGYAGPIPKDDAEYLELIKKAPDDISKQQITKAWTEKKTQ